MSEAYAQRRVTQRSRTKGLSILTLVLVGLAAWAPKIPSASPFWFDDYNFIDWSYGQQLRFHLPLYLPWAEEHRPLGRDLITLLLRIFGEDPDSFHSVQLGVHIVNAVLVWCLLFSLTRASLPALAGAGLLLLSPSAYHPILWTATIFDLVSTTFAVGALLAIVRAVRSASPGPTAGWFLFSLFMVLGAAKLKEDRIVLTPVLVLFILLFGVSGRRILLWLPMPTGPQGKSEEHPGPPGRNLLEPAWVVVATALTALLVLSLGSPVRQAVRPEDHYFVSLSIPTVTRSFAYYLSLLFPWPQAGLFWWPEPGTLRGLLSVSTAILILVPLAMGLRLRSRLILFGWAWYLAFLLPPSLLVNHYELLYYPYTAVAGGSMVVAGLLHAAAARSKGRGTEPIWPLLFMVVLTGVSLLWLYGGAVPRWHENVHTRDREMLAEIRKTLPAVPSGCEVVLAIPGLSPFSHDAAPVLRVLYHDRTLRGRLFQQVGEATAYWHGLGGQAVLLIWDSERFRMAETPDGALRCASLPPASQGQ